VDIVSLQNGDYANGSRIRFVGRILSSVTKPLNRCRLISECFQKGVRELGPVNGFFDEFANRLFNFNRVHEELEIGNWESGIALPAVAWKLLQM